MAEHIQGCNDLAKLTGDLVGILFVDLGDTDRGQVLSRSLEIGVLVQEEGLDLGHAQGTALVLVQEGEEGRRRFVGVGLRRELAPAYCAVHTAPVAVAICRRGGAMTARGWAATSCNSPKMLHAPERKRTHGAV